MKRLSSHDIEACIDVAERAATEKTSWLLAAKSARQELKAYKKRITLLMKKLSGTRAQVYNNA